jgi:ribosomal protein L18
MCFDQPTVKLTGYLIGKKKLEKFWQKIVKKFFDKQGQFMLVLFPH